MRSFLIFAVSAAVLLPSLPVQARETRNLPPSSKWIVDYADQNCKLVRSFGTGQQQLTIMMDQFYPGDSFRVTIVGEALEQSSLKIPSKPKVRFGPTEEPNEISGFSAMLGKTPAFVAANTIRVAPYSEAESKVIEDAVRSGRPYETPPIGGERERAVRTIELGDLLRSADLVLQAGPMDKALDALRACSWDTVKSWGLDVEQQKNRQHGPIPTKPLASLFSPRDYPDDMLRAGMQGVINVRLIVTETGAVESCVIQRSTRPKEFDDLVCKLLMRRARFKPAVDAAGNNIRSFYTQSAVFRIE